MRDGERDVAEPAAQVMFEDAKQRNHSEPGAQTAMVQNWSNFL
jgi:hypothetical protein